jgi:hypothetical protein
MREGLPDGRHLDREVLSWAFWPAGSSGGRLLRRMSGPGRNVRCWGHDGKHLLALRITGFDPKLTSNGSKRYWLLALLLTVEFGVFLKSLTTYLVHACGTRRVVVNRVSRLLVRRLNP